MRHKAAAITCPPPYGYLRCSIKRRPPQLFPAGRERQREARSLRKRRGIMTQRHTHSSPFSFRAISQTAMSRKVSPMGRG